MIEFYAGGTVLAKQEGDTFVIRENPEIGLGSRIGGALGGLAFMSVAALFWSMEIDNADAATPYIRAILCTGLALIGVILARGALLPRKSVEEIALDGAARELRVSKLTPDGKSKLRHTLKFAAIKRFYAGSESDTDIRRGGATVLYAEAEGGPRNGVLMAGSVRELEQIVPEMNRFLNSPPMADTNEAGSQGQSPVRRGGFGRKGN